MSDILIVILVMPLLLGFFFLGIYGIIELWLAPTKYEKEVNKLQSSLSSFQQTATLISTNKLTDAVNELEIQLNIKLTFKDGSISPLTFRVAEQVINGVPFTNGVRYNFITSSQSETTTEKSISMILEIKVLENKLFIFSNKEGYFYDIPVLVYSDDKHLFNCHVPLKIDRNN